MVFGCSLVMAAISPQLSASPNVQKGLEKLPLSGGVLMSRALRSGAVSLPGHRPGNGASTLSPSITVLPNVPADATGQPVNEDPIAADPVTTSHLMSGGNDYSCSSLQGFYNSDNSGASWRQHCMPVLGAGGCGDPNVAYDRNGTGYILGIGDCNGSTGKIVYQKTTDNGLTWTPVAVAFSSLLGGITDKNWTEIDTNSGSPYVNCIYTSWTDFNSGFTQTRASVAHSCDGGATWTRVAADTTRTVPQIDQFTDLAIGSNGTVYLTWMYCKTAGGFGTCSNTNVDMKFSKSTDGGNTWSTPVVIASPNLATGSSCYYGCFPGTSERVANIPVVDYDNSSGKLWVGYYNYAGGKENAYLTSSSDGGATWGPAKLITSVGNQGWLWTANNDAGVTSVSFMHSATAGKYIAAVVTTTNGTTFQKAKLSSVPPMSFSNDGFSGSFIGDYTGAIWTGGTVHVSWMDTRTGSVSSDMTGGATP